MTWLSWVLLIGYVLLSAALYRIFPKAGREAKHALMPGYNMWVTAEIVGRKGWHSLLLLIPFFNVFIFAGLMVDLCRSFNRFNFFEHVLSVVVSWGYFGWLGGQDDLKYRGPILTEEREYRQALAVAQKTGDKREVNKVIMKYPAFQKSVSRDWAEAAIFAIFAAAFIRLLLIESYIIPTPSMEGNLNVGDFLFVSKIHYGLRLPETILMVPLAHNRMPVVGGESYIDGASLPYRRLPALEAIDRFDPVVFNVPAGDSVYLTPQRTYYPHDVKFHSFDYMTVPDQVYRGITTGQIPLITRPLDKRDHYVKRAIGLPGERLEIKNRVVHINGEPIDDPENVQFSYVVGFTGEPNTARWSDWGISPEDYGKDREGNTIMFLNQGQIDKLEANYEGITITPRDQSDGGGVRLYPHDKRYFDNMTVDDYGPVLIPEKGMTVKLDDRTFALYWRAIRVYEDNDFERRGNAFYLNGEEVTEYTFQQDYYWMMGDNRHNSEDSRIWGFVPENHILGKPLFIWFSVKEGSLFNGVNWNRIFRSAMRQGE
ncbi:S26 family signal peptidase [Lewinella sp. W8]|uniref:S26 family signal peptidase n=1 Tax=Lewinella sp. W8 TaxID=2528208 RepID=UPI0010671F87|nr:S26 family signal peptidase [Lewinella sp. W8]MTB51365.1 S26 family signal peptidase [Lewinella sp. W8]